MEQFTTTEVLAKFPAVLSRIAAGEHVLITEEGSGKALAEMTPPAAATQSGNFKDMLMEFRKNHTINATLEELIAWKNEGRK